MPPALIMAIIVAKKVLVGTITSWFFISIALNAISKADVPFVTAIEYFELTKLENYFSNFETKWPSLNAFEVNIFLESELNLYWNFFSNSNLNMGIFFIYS